LTKGEQSSELAKKVFLGVAGSVLISKRLLPACERAPRRQSPGKPRLGSPRAQSPQPCSPSRLGGHPRGRGSPARGRGRRAIGLCAELRGGTSAGRQTRVHPGRAGRCTQSRPARPCPARCEAPEGPSVPWHASSAQRRRQHALGTGRRWRSSRASPVWPDLLVRGCCGGGGPGPKDRGRPASRSSAPRVLCPQARVQKVGRGFLCWSNGGRNRSVAEAKNSEATLKATVDGQGRLATPPHPRTSWWISSTQTFPDGAVPRGDRKPGAAGMSTPTVRPLGPPPLVACRGGPFSLWSTEGRGSGMGGRRCWRVRRGHCPC
ncbi:hypothetical protein MC885_021667, partial [Smutsia gigantea]